jgi:N-methylhydantoinase B
LAAILRRRSIRSCGATAARSAFRSPGKVGGFALRAGDVVVLQSPGGGGYGDPLERLAEEVAADAREGYVTAEHARTVYGVVLGPDGSLNAEATETARRQIAAARVRLAVVEHP